MRKVRENIIPSMGNYPVYPAGQPVFNCDYPTINPLPGQIVIYDPQTQLSLGPGITTDDYDRIVIGVACDDNGDGVANSIRKVFGDQLFGCYINAVTAEPPSCGMPEIHDFLFKCTDCDTPYSINITREDDVTQNSFPYNRPACYTYTAETECGGCDECDPSHDCTDLVCKLIDQINGKPKNRRTLKSRFNKRTEDAEKGFSAVRLYPHSVDYCITPLKGECVDCMEIPAITGVSFGGKTVTFNQTVNPANPANSYQAQLASIQTQINRALDGNGSGIATKGAGVCCPNQLQVNTCFTDFQLLGEGGAPITPCHVSNPFDPINIEKDCKNCDDTPQTKEFKCGIRIIADPVKIECGCFVNVNPQGYLGRKLSIVPGSGFVKGSTYIREVQGEKIPEGIGAIWQYRDYASDTGGSGRPHRPYDMPIGTLGLPSGTSKASNTKVKCDASYCSFILEHQLPNTDTGVHGNKTQARGRSVILIPSGDLTTIESFQEVLNSYVTSSGCPVKQEVLCVDTAGDFIDQDQIETDYTTGTPGYPNANGYIY